MVIMVKILIFIVFSALILMQVKGSPLNITLSAIPTKEEQVNLLTSVQGIFERLQEMAADEAKATDESVANDVKILTRRAIEHLNVYQSFAEAKISSNTNRHCSLDAKDKITELLAEGKDLLKGCLQKTEDDIVESTVVTKNATDAATAKGYDLLDALRACAKGPAFGIIPCYRKIIQEKVKPVEIELLHTIKQHKKGHLRAIAIRTEANVCVDTIVEGFKILIDVQYKNAIKC